MHLYFKTNYLICQGGKWVWEYFGFSISGKRDVQKTKRET